MKTTVTCGFLGAYVYAGQGNFNYTFHGKDWIEDFPTCGIGHEQSPIDIVTSDVVEDSVMHLDILRYKNYHAGNKVLERKEHTLQMEFHAGEYDITFPDGTMNVFEPL